VLDVSEHFGVAEEHQVSVEDLRFLEPDLPGGDGPDPLDLPTHGGHRLDNAAPLSRWGACGAAVVGGGRGAQHPDRSNTDAR